jgi:hypothetical protein
MDAEIAEQLARRDRFRRHQWRLLTPDQRIANMVQLQERSWELLRSNPPAFERWFRRNWSARATQPAEGSDNAD